MKTKNLTLAMFFLVSLLFACENDRIDEAPILPDQRFETVSLESDSQLKNLVTAYAEELDINGYINAFGNVNWTSVIKMKESGTTTYSIARKRDPLQLNELENIIIKDFGVEKSIYIVKYRSDKHNWFSNNNLYSNFNDFSGDITYRKLNDFVFGKSQFVNGVSVKPSLSSARTSAGCDPWVEVVEEDLVWGNHAQSGGFVSGGIQGSYSTWYYVPCPDGSSEAGENIEPNPQGIGGSGGGSPVNPNDNNDDDDDSPCSTGDPTLDDFRIRPILESMWFHSMTERPIYQRVETGGWLVRDANGQLGFVPFPSSWTRTTCGISNIPSDFTNSLPANIIGIIHTHPFFEGDNTLTVCAPDGTDHYTSGFSEDDKNLLLEVIHAAQNIHIKSYIIDGNNISSMDFRQVVTSYPRCGY